MVYGAIEQSVFFRFDKQMNRSFSPDTGHINPTLPMDEAQQDSSDIMAMESDEEVEEHQKYVNFSICLSSSVC